MKTFGLLDSHLDQAVVSIRPALSWLLSAQNSFRIPKVEDARMRIVPLLTVWRSNHPGFSSRILQ